MSSVPRSLSKLKVFLKGNEFDFQNANASFFACDMALRCYTKADSAFGFAAPVFVYLNKKDFHMCFKLDDLHRIGKYVFDSFVKNSAFFHELLAAHKKITEEFNELFLKGLDTCSLFSKLVDVSNEWWSLALLGEDKGVYFSDRCEELLIKNGKSKEEAKEIISVVSHPQKTTFGEMEQLWNTVLLRLSTNKDLLTLVNKGEMNNEINELYLDFYNNYFFKNTTFFDAEKFTKDVFLRDVKNELKTKTSEGLRFAVDEYGKEQARLKRNKEKLFSSLSDEEKVLLTGLREFIEWVEFRKFGMMNYLYKLFGLMKKIAKEYDVAFSDINYALVTEIKSLFTGVPLPLDKITLRKNQSFFFYDEEELFLFHDAANELFTLAKKVNDADFVKGMIASKGKLPVVIGRAKVIKDPSLDAFAAGDILITSMTRIEFVPLMRKAAAIVTDEGGIACHAAIVSRELGIPCVIGTKLATHVFKSGEMIKIDMSSGEVKILKRK